MSDQTHESTLPAASEIDGGDPSMEDILASIRRIIADDVVVSDEEVLPAASDLGDLRDKAAISGLEADQNDVLVKSEAAASSELVVDALELDDILVMDDESFSSNDLDIPDAELFEALEEESDDILIADDDDLKVDITDSDDVDFQLSDLITGETQPDATEDLLKVDELPELCVDSDDADIAALLDDEIDLLIADDNADDLELTDTLVLTDVDLDDEIDISAFEDAPLAADGNAVLDIVESGLANVKTDDVDIGLQAEDNAAKSGGISDGLDVEASEAAKHDDDILDFIDDLMGDFGNEELTGDAADDLANDDLLSDVAAVEEEVSGEGVSALDDEIMSTDLTGDDDIDALKSLLSNLTDDSFLSDSEPDDLAADIAANIGEAGLDSAADAAPETVPETASETSPLLPEAEIMDDILELTLVDEEMSNLDSVAAGTGEFSSDEELLAQLAAGDSLEDMAELEIPQPEPEDGEGESQESLSVLEQIAVDAENDARAVQDDLAQRQSEAEIEAEIETETVEVVTAEIVTAEIEVADVGTVDIIAAEIEVSEVEVTADDIDMTEDGDAEIAAAEIESDLVNSPEVSEVEAVDSDVTDAGVTPSGETAETAAAAKPESDPAVRDLDTIFTSALAGMPASDTFLKSEGEGVAPDAESAPAETASKDAAVASASGTEAQMSEILDETDITEAEDQAGLDEVLEISDQEIIETQKAETPEAEAPETGTPETKTQDIETQGTDQTVQTPKQEPTDMPQLVAKDGIIDQETEAATSEAFASLVKAVEERTEVKESGPRIGDLVQGALQPMLKEWLEENLNGIVERAVAKEVKRISSQK